MRVRVFRMFAAGAAAVLLLSACGGGEDATADATPSPSPVTTTASPTPSPTADPSPSAEPDPFPGISMTFTGGKAGDPRVEALRTFFAGSAYAWSEWRVQPEVRAVASRSMQRVIVNGADKARRNAWVVSQRPIVHVASLSGRRGRARAAVCRWTPSTDWRRKSDNANVQKDGRNWHRLSVSLRKAGNGWQITDVTGDGNCDRKAP